MCTRRTSGTSPIPARPNTVEAAHSESTEYGLMAISIAVAFIGIGLAWYFFLSHPSAADRVAESAAPVHDCCSNKYYVDEIYDAAIVQPIVGFSRGGAVEGRRRDVIDGAVNGVGAVVGTSAGLLRRLQTGSVRAYAASLLLGVGRSCSAITCGAVDRRASFKSMTAHLLTSLIALPLVGALLVAARPQRDEQGAPADPQHRPRRVALVVRGDAAAVGALRRVRRPTSSSSSGTPGFRPSASTTTSASTASACCCSCSPAS